MKYIRTSSICLILLTNLLLPQSAAVSNDYENIIKSIRSLHIVSYGKVPAAGITIEKDAATFKLKSGVVYRFSDVADRESFLLFKGSGEFYFIPPLKTEQDQLERFYEKKTLDEKFNTLFMIFSDTANLELFSAVEFKELTSSNNLIDDYVEPLSYLLDTDAGYFDTDFMHSFLERKSNSLFYAHIEFDNFERLFFKISPYDFEEVTLSRRKSHTFFTEREKDLICSFHQNNKFSDSEARKQTLNIVNVPLYKINLTIEDNLEVRGEAELIFNLNQPNSRWINLFLYEEFEVDSVKINGNKTRLFYRGKENPELWINLPEMIDLNKTHSLTIFYHGELLEKDEFGWIAIKSSSDWFPNYYSRDNSYFELKFNYPADYELVSIGEQTSFSEDEEVKSSSWKNKIPSHNASFNIGKFEKYEFTEKDLPKVKVFISPSGHSKLSHMLVQYEILSGADMEEKIGTDILASLEFYQKVYGVIPLNEINVTEIPYLHGEAFPGLVHLSWFNYQGTGHDKSGELMRAHEVAHQWWGIGVDFDDYHDQWISEGFAEFSALYFVQVGFGIEDYFDILDNWKKDIIENRKYIIGQGQKSGPIWLGYRTNSSETEGDYSTIVYKKGAWVLHMLRNMLIDLKTMDEDRFKGLMKEFFSSYYGKKATIKDFKKLADKYAGADLEWFFKQYIYGTDIPEYNFSYTSEKRSDGKFYTTCKIIQNNVPDDFKMYVPIKIVLPGNKLARLRIEVKGKETIFNIPALPEEPEEIIFNDLNSVLCEVDYD